MLQSIRNKAQSPIIQALVLVIAVVFIFWGVGGMNNQNNAAAVVNGEEITFREFQRALDQSVDRLKSQFGGSLPEGMIETLGIKQQVINQLIQEELLRQGGNSMGLLASTTELQEIISSTPQFQNNGAFNEDTYRNILKLNRTTPNKYEDKLRRDMLSTKTMGVISRFAGIVTDFEIDDLYSLDKEMISLEYIQISPADFIETIEVNEKDLGNWFKTHDNQYKTAPEVQLTYLFFPYSQSEEKITIDGKQVQQQYNKDMARYKTPETRQASHILIQTDSNMSAEAIAQKKAQAEKILVLARSGNDFSELAKQYSEGPSGPQGGDLGFFNQGQMVPTFDKAVFSMTEGEISALVTTQYGFHIIQVVKIKPASTKSIDEVKDSIVVQLKTRQAQAMTFAAADDAYRGIISAGSLKNYIEKNPQAPIKTTDFFSQASPADSIPKDPEFLNSAFALKLGALSSLVKSASGYSILFAENTKAPAVPPLADVQEQVKADYIQDKSGEHARNKANEILKSLAEGADFSTLAEAQGLKVFQSGLLSKDNDNNDSKFPASLTQNAFSLTTSTPLPNEPGVVGTDLYVYKFIERKLPDNKISAQERLRYKQTLLRLKQNQILTAWLKNQENTAKELAVHKDL